MNLQKKEIDIYADFMNNNYYSIDDIYFTFCLLNRVDFAIMFEEKLRYLKNKLFESLELNNELIK